MGDKGEAGFNDPLGEYFDGFNIIEFMNDSDDLIESLAERSTSSKSSSSAAANNKLPQTINTYTPDQNSSSRNTESVEGEVWISPVPSDDYQLPQTMNPLNFTSNNNINNNVYIIDPSTSNSTNNNNTMIQQTRPQPTTNNLPHNPNYPSTMSYSNQNNNNQQIQYPSPPQYSTIINQQQQQQFISPTQLPQLQQQSFNNNINERQNNANNNYSNLMGPPPMKRKAPGTSDLLIPSTPMIIKQEPMCDYGNGSNGNNMMISPSISRMESLEDLQQRQIKFIPFNVEQWTTLYNISQQPFNNLRMEVIADKGFNYNFVENAFINQKKNHFQITVNINLGSPTKPAYFCVNGILKEITDFKLALCGIKAESPNVEIGLKQSNSDRKLIDYEPTSVQIGEKQQLQIKVPRLHFSETTLNNQRKAGKPIDQKYFQLAVKLQVYSSDGSFCIVQAYQSEKVIVRAGNPAQFDHNPNRSQLEPNTSSSASNSVVGGAGASSWQKNKNLIYTYSPVSIGTDQQFPGALLSIAGNIVSTGNFTKPSDRRVKEDIVNYDTRGATNRLAQVQIVGYSYLPEFADEWGLDESNRHRIGVIAQQVADVLPDAVKENGEYLTVDENRIFMETVAAAQELYRVTGNLESKIGQVEKISVKLAKFAKNNKQKFGGSTISGLTTYLEDNNTTAKKDEDGRSIYSITSTAPSSCNGSPSHHHRRYNQHHQQQQDMCSSKFTQYTVTFLIGIMALCLLSMCSLYILDWYRRISNDPHGNLIPTFNYSDDTSIGNLIEQKYELPLSWLPDSQPNAPLLASKCGLTRQCPIYCCENEIMEKNGKHLRTNRSITYPDMALITNVDKNFYDLSTPLPFEQNFSLNIVNLNISIDQRFCVEHSCRPRKGRYNLYVPISPLLPTIPLKIKFTVKENKFIDNCGSLRDFFHKKCNNNFIGIEEIEHPTSYTLNENTFELSVGDFVHSAYRFRIGYTTESCNMSEDQRGRSFDEFNIVFYRKCFS